MWRWLIVAGAIVVSAIFVACCFGAIICVISAVIAAFLGHLGLAVEFALMAALYLAVARLVIWSSLRLYRGINDPLP